MNWCFLQWDANKFQTEICLLDKLKLLQTGIYTDLNKHNYEMLYKMYIT
jgi:glutathionylspermidine synthase